LSNCGTQFSKWQGQSIIYENGTLWVVIQKRRKTSWKPLSYRSKKKHLNAKVAEIDATLSQNEDTVDEN
jgi:hypothetical protein